eukprot:8652226-Alexandrium_andersonii.AAC.1
MSSSPGILQRVCFPCDDEGRSAGGPKIHEHAVLQGKSASGRDLAARAAAHPPRLARGHFPWDCVSELPRGSVLTGASGEEVGPGQS